MGALGTTFIQRIVFQNTKQPFYSCSCSITALILLSALKGICNNILGNLWIFHNPQSHIIHHFIVFPIYIIEKFNLIPGQPQSPLGYVFWLLRLSLCKVNNTPIIYNTGTSYFVTGIFRKRKIIFCRFLVTKRVSHVLYIVKGFKQSDRNRR